jgi:hypothetical protein
MNGDGIFNDGGEYHHGTTIEGMEAIHEYENAAHDENLTEAERQMREEELSFYSNSEHDFGDDNIWGLLSGVGGNIYEWCVTSIVIIIDYYKLSLVGR